MQAITLSALAGFVLVYAVVAFSGVLENVALLWWNDMAWTVSSLAAGLKSLHTARSHSKPGERRAWYAFGIAALMWFGGMLVWDYLELVRGVVIPYPSAADVFFVGFAVAFIAGIFLYRDNRPARYVNQIQFSNLGIIVCTVIIVSSVVLYPQIKASEESYLYIGVSIAYSVVFMSAVIFGAFSYWFYECTSSRTVFPLILLALFIHAVADGLYAFQLLGKTYGATNFLNLFWIMAFAVQYWAAVVQDSHNRAPAPPVRRPAPASIQNLEGVAPSLSLLSVLLTLWIFSDSIEYGLLKFVFAVALVLMLFLVVREWSLSRSLTDARRHLEEEVRQRTLQLTRVNRELEAYSYSIAHDLRAPLRAVTGFSQILLEDTRDKLDADEQQSLQRIANAGKSMAVRIDDILDLARISRVDMQWEPIDLSALCSQVLKRLSDGETERDVEVSIQPGMQMSGDTTLMTLVLENLIGNALKYSAGRPGARVDISASGDKDETILRVSDNGVGFDMKYYAKLFEPFQRLHSGDEFPGTGVGLATVRRIVERHGGRVWAQAAPGEGATFFVVLPGPGARRAAALSPA